MRRANYPNLTDDNHRITSPAADYNCVAWAVEDTDRCWWPWPDETDMYYWPNECPREETVEAFEVMFGRLGYEPCEITDHEPGFERVAIYASRDGEPKHAARQLPNGAWTSKIGSAEDIEHLTLSCLEGEKYGTVQRLLRRRRPDWLPSVR